MQGTDQNLFDKALDSLLFAIKGLETQSQRFDFICEANRREQASYTAKQQQLAEDIERAKADIEQKKQELELAKLERQRLEEYEVLRKQIHQQQPRWRTQQEMDKVAGDVEAIQADTARLKATFERRRKQYALLYHTLDELQRLDDFDADDDFSDAAEPMPMDESV